MSAAVLGMLSSQRHAVMCHHASSSARLSASAASHVSRLVGYSRG